MLSLNGMPAVASMFSAYASFSATLMLIRSMINELIPRSLQTYFYDAFSRFFIRPSSNLTVIIPEESGMTINKVYGDAELFLRNKMGPATERLRVSKTQRQQELSVLIEKGEEIVDEFDGFQLRWRYVSVQPEHKEEERSFELTFDKKFKNRVIDSYLPYVLDRAERIREEERVVRLFSRSARGPWNSINLEHPSTFKTLAMDPELKKSIIEDLDRFLGRREFYKRVGKAWKRGYLLYGPPGTGKSSLIAAMANYLKFDIYDLELTDVYSNSDLRSVLLSTTNKSILVIEDVDCSVKMRDHEDDHTPQNSKVRKPKNEKQISKLTLSGLLNFIDGLWSSCGDERIIVFTTNYKDRLDPALLRPGRMDMHINMSYCSAQGFKVLASNYLGPPETCQNPLYQEVQSLIDSTQVTPAEVAEELMVSDDSIVALRGLVDFLKRKIEAVEKDEVLEEKEMKEKKTKNSRSRFATNIRKFFKRKHKRKDNTE